MEAEIATLIKFWNAGKSLFVALEIAWRSKSPLHFSSELHVTFDPTSLAHGSLYMPTSSRALPIHKRN